MAAGPEGCSEVRGCKTPHTVPKLGVRTGSECVCLWPDELAHQIFDADMPIWTPRDLHLGSAWNRRALVQFHIYPDTAQEEIDNDVGDSWRSDVALDLQEERPIA